jgi:hypothetical protein
MTTNYGKSTTTLQNVIPSSPPPKRRYGLIQHQALFDLFKGQKKRLENLSSFS